MITVDRIVVVEGKYDRIKLAGILDATVICTDGFGIFKNEGLKKTLRALAEKRGLLILTDSDSAGFLIRSHIKGFVSEGEIKNVFIPDVFGKEKRKSAPSKEGKLGVEGMDRELLENALKKAGIVEEKTSPNAKKVLKSDLFEDGISGGADSKAKRTRLLKELGLPERMSANALLETVNALYSFEEYKAAVSRI